MFISPPGAAERELPRTADELLSSYRATLLAVTHASDEIVERIVEQYPRGRALRSAPPHELHELGLTPAQARRLRTALDFSDAHRALGLLELGQQVRGPEDAALAVAQVCRRVGGLEQECFVLLCLSARQHLLDARAVALGSIAQVEVHPREVYRTAIRLGAHSIVVGHCHPSGDPSPSQADIELTRRLCEVGRLVGVPLLDHLIVTETRHTSLAAIGLMGSAP